MKTSRAIGLTQSILDRSIFLKGITAILLSNCILSGGALAASKSSSTISTSATSTNTNSIPTSTNIGKGKADAAS